MPEYLVGISYHEPNSFALWQRGFIEDYESSTGLWVTAESPSDAISWGKHVGEARHRWVNTDPFADWTANYECWLEDPPEASGWLHCLDFFQRVRVGEMPDHDRMGTQAHARWQAEHA